MDWQNYGSGGNPFGDSWTDGGQMTDIRRKLFEQLGIPMDAFTPAQFSENGMTPSSLTEDAQAKLASLNGQYFNNGYGNGGGFQLTDDSGNAVAGTGYDPEKTGAFEKLVPLIMAGMTGYGLFGGGAAAGGAEGLFGGTAAGTTAPTATLLGGSDALGLEGLFSGSGAAANAVAGGGALAGGSGGILSGLSGSGMLSTLGPLATAAIGAATSKDQTQTTNRDPWGPAQPWIKDNIASASDLQKQYQANPFSDDQKTAYGNIANIINGANGAAPAFWGGMAANATGANNYDRSNPRRKLIGTDASMPGYSMGLLNPFGG